MESSSDSGKVGHVSISVTDEQNQPTPSAAAAASSPQLKFYFVVLLYALALPYMFLLQMLLVFGDHQDKGQSPFKTYGGVFMITSIVTLFVAILASAILIFTSHYLQTLMRDVHYTVGKIIGCFSAIIAVFCLLVVVIVPDNSSPWIKYPVICILFAASLFGCYKLWKLVCVPRPDEYGPEKSCGNVPAFVFPMGPFILTSIAFIPSGLDWIRNMVLCLDLTILVASCVFTAYMTLFYGRNLEGAESDSNPSPPIQRQTTNDIIVVLQRSSI